MSSGEPLDSEDWCTMERITTAIHAELDDFLKDAFEVTPEARQHFRFGVLVGVTRTLQWIKIRGSKQ